MKINERGILLIAVLSLVAFVILAQSVTTRNSSAAELQAAATLSTVTTTPTPPDNYLPLVAKQPTLTPTPTQTPTPTPSPTNTPTLQPTVMTSAQYCHGPFLPIPNDETSILFDTISIGSSGNIVDLDVYINTTHSWVGDLRFTLTHDGVGPSRAVIDRPGFPGSGLGCSGNNISAILDDNAVLPVESQCAAPPAPAISGRFIPNEALSAFNNQNVNGSWTMKIEDVITSDGGVFNGWCMFVDFTSAP